MNPVLIALLGCTQPSEPPAAPPPADVAATVNGEHVTEADLELAARRGSKGATELSPERRENVLDVIVGKELRAQRAEALGLDAHPGYLERIRPLEAQLASLRRDQLSDLLVQREVIDKATVDDADARAWFEAHRAQLTTDLHVLQILRSDPGEIEALHGRITGGEAFEDVAASLFPGLPPGAGRPWDLGMLRWAQLPPQWRGIVDELQPGAVSDIIEGPGTRRWIVQLVATEAHPERTYEEVQAWVVEHLKAERIAELEAELDASLRAEATVEVP